MTGEASSYGRVHGEVSRAPTEWRDIASVARETLDDVRYQKAEGIAKACTVKCNPSSIRNRRIRMPAHGALGARVDHI